MLFCIEKREHFTFHFLLLIRSTLCTLKEVSTIYLSLRKVTKINNLQYKINYFMSISFQSKYFYSGEIRKF